MRLLLDRTIRRIEREANNELLQLSSLGPQYFPTPDLYDLLEQLEFQKEIVVNKLSNLYRIGGFIPIFFLGYFLASYFSYTYIMTAFMVAIPAFCVAIAYRSYQIRREHPTYFSTKNLEKNIRLELQRRREESSIS